MSRTTLCAGTAAGLIALSLLLMIGRYRVLGDLEKEGGVKKSGRSYSVAA